MLDRISAMSLPWLWIKRWYLPFFIPCLLKRDSLILIISSDTLKIYGLSPSALIYFAINFLKKEFTKWIVCLYWVLSWAVTCCKLSLKIYLKSTLSNRLISLIISKKFNLLNYTFSFIDKYLMGQIKSPSIISFE